jgi:PTS system fructose-specific IIA component
MLSSSIPYIHELLSAAFIRVELPGTSKQDILDHMIEIIADHPSVQDPVAIRAAVLEREEVMSTGVGKGLGLPHAKTAAVGATVAAFAITANPVEFGAIDNEPVRLVFLLVGTEQAKSEHIKILSRISRLLNRDAFRHRLLKAKSAQEVLTAFEEGETQLVG